MSTISLNLSASYERTSVQAVSERTRMWIGERPREQARPQRADERPDPGLLLERQLANAARSKPAATDAPDAGLDPETDRTLLILEKLFGMKGLRKFLLKLQQMQGDAGSAQQPAATAAPATTTPGTGQQAAGWGLEYDRTEIRTESETASLSASGTYTQDDGSQITFTLNWSQHRETVQTRQESLRLGDAQATDPLALDLDGNGLAFASELMPLDLHGDGQAEQVHRLAAGDVWLAYDRNGDGQVADGGELFGPSTGNAFNELKALDTDHNGVVDAQDAAWGRLGVWNGNRITPLAQAGVAGIATSSVALPYTHQAADGSTAAQGRSGGVWLGNDGRIGAALQVDLIA